MGRNALTYRQRLQLELDKWRNFRKALLRDEREAFDVSKLPEGLQEF